jgi:hypothetical protein
VVRAFGIYSEGPGFKSLSGHFHILTVCAIIYSQHKNDCVPVEAHRNSNYY